MDRRDLLKKMIAVLPAFLIGKCSALSIPKVKVETLEYWPTTYYRTRWEFDTVDEAETFVRSLIPELHELRLRLYPYSYPKTSQLRSGYRAAVRAQYKEDIEGLACKIVSQKTGESVYPDWIGKINAGYFWSIGSAWGYLANIRVDGKPVSRDCDWQGTKCFSQYLTEPFRKGNPTMLYWDAEKRKHVEVQHGG